MLCHECLAAGEQQSAVAICRFCSVGLCKAHLMELFRRASGVPQSQYTCHHTPAS